MRNMSLIQREENEQENLLIRIRTGPDVQYRTDHRGSVQLHEAKRIKHIQWV